MSSTMSDNWVLIFDTVHQVIKAEKALKKGVFEIRIIPTPREFSSDCGMAIELRGGIDRAVGLLRSVGAEPRGVHPLGSKLEKEVL